jgi:hypothetical protein
MKEAMHTRATMRRTRIDIPRVNATVSVHSRNAKRWLIAATTVAVATQMLAACSSPPRDKPAVTPSPSVSESAAEGTAAAPREDPSISDDECVIAQGMVNLAAFTDQMSVDEVAASYSDSLRVTSDTFRKLASVTSVLDEASAWAAVADAAQSANEQLAIYGGEIYKEEVLNALLELKETFDAAAVSVIPALGERCGTDVTSLLPAGAEPGS